MASGADLLHLKIDKKKNAMLHSNHCILSPYHSHIAVLQFTFFLTRIARFSLRFLCLIYLLARNKSVQYFLIDFYFKAVAHFLDASLIEREEIVCFHSIGHVGI